MDKKDYFYDIDTGGLHVFPVGLEHQARRKKGAGRWITCCKIPHYIVSLHQSVFLELSEKMRDNPDASNIYTAFLCMLPLEIKGVLTPDIRRKILRSYKLL